MGNQEERTWGMFCHLAALVALLGVPFGHIIGPLVVWLIKKDQSPFVDDQGREALNFQLTLTIYGLVIVGVTIVISILTCALGAIVLVPLAALLFIALEVVGIVFAIIAAINVNNGVAYRYPFSMRFF